MNKVKAKPRILISLNNGWTIRNWIYTGIIDDLAKKFKVMVLTPVKNDSKFNRILKKRNMFIKTSLLHVFNPNPLIRIIRVMKDTLFYGINGVETQKIMKFEKRRSPLERGIAFFILTISKITGLKKLIPWLERLENFLYRKKIYEDVLIQFNPDLLISTHPFGETERRIIIEAHKKKIPVFASILSWDNLSNKGMLPLFLDKIIVWNQIQARRTLSYHPQYNSNHIIVSGIPHFDIYCSKESENFNRENYLKSIKIDPQNKVLLYCTGAASLMPREPEIIEILVKNMDNGNIPSDTYLLIRCHPHDDVDRYEKFFNHERVTISKPSLDIKRQDTFTWIPPEDEIVSLMAMLKASNLLLNIASTTSLDGAACEIPIINISFDGYRNDPYLNSVRRFYDFTHYRDVVKTQSVKIVNNEEELIYWINHYLEDPCLDKEKREKLVSKQCWKLDGKSSERVIEIISDFLIGKSSKE